MPIVNTSRLESRKDEILELYHQGYSFRKVAILIGEPSSKDSVEFVINKYAPEIIRKKSLLNKGNTDYFENIDTHIKAYFLGFIAADGCIMEAQGRNLNNTHKLEITINVKDKIVLEKFKEELGTNLSLKEKPETRAVRFHIQDKKLTDDIMKYGIVPRKSLILGNVLENIPEEFKSSFVLGYFDGDGSASYVQPIGPTGTGLSKKGIPYKKRLQISILGTLELIKGIVEDINLINYYLYHKYKEKNTYQLQIAKKSELIKLYNYMYGNCPFFLYRKHDKFLESGILNEI